MLIVIYADKYILTANDKCQYSHPILFKYCLFYGHVLLQIMPLGGKLLVFGSFIKPIKNLRKQVKLARHSFKICLAKSSVYLSLHPTSPTSEEATK